MPTRSQFARVKPPALRKGDTVGIVAPASSFKRDEFEVGCQVLRQMGYHPVYDESIFDCDLYFAGTAERRARELEAMFLRDDVKAILCVRGGYGSNYLLPMLDVKKLAAKPKIFVGYSDLTSLLTYFCDAGGLVTFHGPMVAKDFAKLDGVDLESWQNAVSGVENWQLAFGSGSGVKALAQGQGKGTVEGVLYGGCLSMLVASLGTPYEIQTDGTILFIEDIATKPYQIDRMLMHLKLAGKFAGVRGIIFGEMLDCVQAQNQGYTLEEVVMRVVGDLGVPVAYGLRSGHVSRENITLPLGVRAALSVGSAGVTLDILEPATLS
jgi:muramoyltetrapeptide carboxypeptidase